MLPENGSSTAMLTRASTSYIRPSGEAWWVSISDGGSIPHWCCWLCLAGIGYTTTQSHFLSTFITSILAIYITLSWSHFESGGGLGQRNLIQIYPLMAFPLATIIAWFIRTQEVNGFGSRFLRSTFIIPGGGYTRLTKVAFSRQGRWPHLFSKCSRSSKSWYRLI